MESGKTAVIGIGNVLRGDDAIGPMAIKRLMKSHGDSDIILLLDSGPAPENVTKPIVNFRPDKIIIIDAVEMGKEPGKVAQITIDQVKEHMASTHKMPITVFLEYLQNELPVSELIFIGVQQKSTGFGLEMSGEAMAGMEEAIARVSSLLEQ